MRPTLWISLKRSLKPFIFTAMKMIKCAFLLSFILATMGAHSQTYKVFKGDTINRLDKNERKQGLWRKYYTTDTLFSEGIYKDNVPLGTFLSYHKNGKLQARLIYRGNSGVCDAELYSPEGILIGKGKYTDQKKDSLWTYFDEMGLMTARETYVRGKKQGLAVVYYPNGQASREVFYENDVISGVYHEYFDTGKIKIQARMEDGEFTGQALVFHPNGNIWQKGGYKKGMKDGAWIIMHENGQIEREELYDKGKLLNPVNEGD